MTFYESCPRCGEKGQPRWSNIGRTKPAPVNTANRGILRLQCGVGYSCDAKCSRTGPCNQTFIYCYRCTTKTSISNQPTHWQVCYNVTNG